MKALKKSGLCLVAMMFGLMGLLATSSIALAESIDDVEVRVTASRDWGEIDQSTYDDLKGTLDEARSATGSENYDSATEAYNLLAPPSLSAQFDSYGT